MTIQDIIALGLRCGDRVSLLLTDGTAENAIFSGFRTCQRSGAVIRDFSVLLPVFKTVPASGTPRLLHGIDCWPPGRIAHIKVESCVRLLPEDVRMMNKMKDTFEAQSTAELKRLLAFYADRHPGRPKVYVGYAGYDATFEGKHDSFPVNVISVGAKDGRLVFDVSSSFYNETDTPLVFDAGYGVFIQDYAYLLQEVQESILRHCAPEYDDETHFFDFLRKGASVRWNDHPELDIAMTAPGKPSATFRVETVPEDQVLPDDLITIRRGHVTHEVPARELEPA